VILPTRIATVGVGILAAGALALSLTACSSGSSDASAAGSGATTTIKFALDWTPNTNHTGLFVAESKGWFKKAGINVDVLPYSDSTTDTLINSGAAQFGISFEDQALAAAAAGTTTTSVMSVLQHDATAVGVLKSATDIQSPKDLDGKIYGDAGGSSTFKKMLSDAMKSDGGTGKFDTVTLGTSAYQALYKGKVDIVGAFKTWEGIQATLNGTPMKYFDFSDYGLPDDYSVLIEGNNAWLKKNPAEAKKFVRILQRGYTYAANHPDAAAKILIDENPGVFDNDKLVYASQRLISKSYLKDADGKVGTQTSAMWQDLADYYAKKGILADKNGKTLTTPLDTSKLFSTAYISK
jgi:ABC-type nitrate/sulfonate/bicarbonate transport system substrate-binding protein